MKPEHLSDAIGNLDEKLCAEANEVRKKKRRPRWIAWVAAAACIAIVIALSKPLWNQKPNDEKVPLGRPKDVMLLDADSDTAKQLLFRAQYPKAVNYPTEMNDWDRYSEELDRWYAHWNEVRTQAHEPQEKAYFERFYQDSAKEFLGRADGENVVFSPSNVYMALAMLAELTDGESRAQILQTLGANSIEELRTQAKYLWLSNYSDDGVLTTVMANSIWLDEGVLYNQSTLEQIAQDYYASSYQGVMGSEEYSAVLRDWLNKQTGGLLKESVKDVAFEKDTLLALASTIYFKGRWCDSFNEMNTTQDTFYGAQSEQTADFMRTLEDGSVYWGESYTAIEKSMQNDAAMWLILPDEGKTVDDVLAEGEIFDMTARKTDWSQKKWTTISLSMPKFDVSSNFSLTQGLKNLGVTDVFDPSISDFTPMCDLEELFVSRAEHAARVMVDEEGCEAAAYTLIITEATGALWGEDIVEFVLDRPFIFVITGCGDQPLFIGVVNQV